MLEDTRSRLLAGSPPSSPPPSPSVANNGSDGPPEHFYPAQSMLVRFPRGL